MICWTSLIVKGRIAGDDLNFKCFIPVGYCIVFSIEEQPQGPTRHLSMSVDEDECLPAIEVVELVMQFLGYNNELKKCLVTMEIIDPVIPGGIRNAVNVYELI